MQGNWIKKSSKKSMKAMIILTYEVDGWWIGLADDQSVESPLKDSV